VDYYDLGSKRGSERLWKVDLHNDRGAPPHPHAGPGRWECGHPQTLEPDPVCTGV